MTGTRKNKQTDNAEEKEEFKVILDAMKEMKEDIINDRVLKDQEILEQISDINTKLSAKVSAHDDKINDLETYRDESKLEHQNLWAKLNEVVEENKELRGLIRGTINHSKRLNLHLLNFPEPGPEQSENIDEVVRDFFKTVLKIDGAMVDSFKFRDVHRLGKLGTGKEIKIKVNGRTTTKKYPVPIIVAFTLMSDRNLVYKSAYRCKKTGFAIRCDLPPEMIPTRKAQVDIKNEIKKVNPNALASCAFRSYKPILLVKYNGKVQEYSPTMAFKDLEVSDRRDVDDS